MHDLEVMLEIHLHLLFIFIDVRDLKGLWIQIASIKFVLLQYGGLKTLKVSAILRWYTSYRSGQLYSKHLFLRINWVYIAHEIQKFLPSVFSCLPFRGNLNHLL